MSIQTLSRSRIATQAVAVKNKENRRFEQEQALAEQEGANNQGSSVSGNLDMVSEHQIHEVGHSEIVAESVLFADAFGDAGPSHTDALSTLATNGNIDVTIDQLVASTMSDWTPVGKDASTDVVLLAQAMGDTAVVSDGNDDHAAAICAISDWCFPNAVVVGGIGAAAATAYGSHEHSDDASSNSSSPTADNTPPSLTGVIHIESNNSHTGYAEAGDIITLTFTTDGTESNAGPTVTIDGQQASVSPGSNPNEYVATFQLLSGYTAGSPVAFTIDAVDASGNQMTTVNATTDSMDVMLIDTSVVVFDVMTGESSDHSGRHFDSNVTYSIYILADNGTSTITMPSKWSGGENLGSDDTIYLVGKTGTIFFDYHSSSPANPVANVGTTLTGSTSMLGIVWKTGGSTHNNVASVVATGYFWLISNNSSNTQARATTSLWTATSSATWASSSTPNLRVPQAGIFTQPHTWLTTQQPLA